MFQDKFKERKPEETIKLIQNFFKIKNFELIKNINKQTDAGTFICQFTLYYNKIKILSANGKGMTEIFAAASGLAELYERFCNFYFLYSNNIIFYNEYIKNKKIKKITKTQALSSFDYLQDFINLNLDKENYYDFEYQSINNKEEKIAIDPSTIYRITTTNGMAAGNTLEEALNQGISEIFERYVLFEFYQNKIDKYYILEKDDIENEQIKNIITNIEENNNKIFFIDFSYNYNLPVIGCFCLDLETNCIRCSFGSFIIFDIAIERCLTELFQDLSLKTRINESLTPTPEIFYKLRIKDKGNMGLCGCLPKSFLNKENFIYNHKINLKIFYDDCNKNNKEILEINKQIANNNNFNIYYRNVSLNKDFYAVHILTNKSQINYGISQFFETTNQKIKDLCLYMLKNNLSLIQDIIYNNISSKDFIKKYYKFFENYIKYWDQDLYILTYFFEQSGLYYNIKIYPIISNLIINQHIDINQIDYLKNTSFYKPFKLLYTVVQFKESNQYSNEELFNLLNDLGIEISKDFIKNCTNLEYVIDECYIKIIKNDYLILQTFVQSLVLTGLT